MIVNAYVTNVGRLMITVPPVVYIQWFRCQRCRWTRFYDTRPHVQNSYYDHPIYGRVNGKTLVNLDILNHDCDAAAAAHNRAVQRKLRTTIQQEAQAECQTQPGR